MQNSNSIYFLPGAYSHKESAHIEQVSLMEALKKKNHQLAKAQEIATARISHLMAQVDELMARLETREEQLCSLQRRMTSQNRRALRLR